MKPNVAWPERVWRVLEHPSDEFTQDELMVLLDMRWPGNATFFAKRLVDAGILEPVYFLGPTKNNFWVTHRRVKYRRRIKVETGP